jgi:spectinomycin phosphotransferase/16S rRNA (guanine(1405)-N(7))-methyltransferase
VLTRPAGLTDETLARLIAAQWDVTPAVLEYRAVGFGSHHWYVTDANGASWFATVDDVGAEPTRLLAALETAVDLLAAGCGFVVAPLRTRNRTAWARLGRFVLALYPNIEGETYSSGEFSDDAHRRGVLDLVVALHSLPIGVAPHATVEDFVIRDRGELERGLDGDAMRATGPYAVQTARLIERSAPAVRASLAEYDRLVGVVRGSAPQGVVTHGEPHAANTIRAPSGWMLIDWETVLVAPPERDLWTVAAGDSTVLEVYSQATATEVSDEALALYELRWDLTEIAVYVRRFRRPHAGDADDDKSWDGLVASIDNVIR